MTVIILVSLSLFLDFLLLLSVIAIGAYLVKMNKKFNDPFDKEFFDEEKTWDEKYEEDLEKISRLNRQTSNLADLPLGNAPIDGFKNSL